MKAMTTRMALIMLLFPLAAALFFYVGYTSAPGAVTGEGYPQNMFFYVLGTVLILMPVISLAVFRQVDSRLKSEHLHKSWKKGEAKILCIEQTGCYDNEKPQIRFMLRVLIPDHELYELQHEECIPVDRLNQISPGTRVQVYVDPENDQNLILALEEPIA